MAANEDFRQRPLYEDLFYRYYRPASEEEQGERISAGELYLSLQRKSGVKLAPGKIAHFGRFLKSAVERKAHTRRGVLYSVVEK